MYFPTRSGEIHDTDEFLPLKDDYLVLVDTTVDPEESRQESTNTALEGLHDNAMEKKGAAGGVGRNERVLER